MKVWLTPHHAWNKTQLVLYIMMQKHSVKQQICLRSIAIQTLAPRKKKTKKPKKSDSAYHSNSNISCPVATSLTPVEI